MMNFGALKWFGSFIKKLKINRGRDSSVGKSSVSQAGFESQWGIDSGHTMHEWDGKRLTTVKVILHQLAWLTGA